MKRSGNGVLLINTISSNRPLLMIAKNELFVTLILALSKQHLLVFGMKLQTIIPKRFLHLITVAITTSLLNGCVTESLLKTLKYRVQDTN